MKIRHLFLLASAVALFTNCMQDEIEVPLTSGTVVATMEDDATKTNVDENFAFTWTTGDKIAIHTTDSNLEGTLKGEGGSTDGTFTYSYYGNAPELSGYATYPYNDGHKVTDNELTFVLPATYTLTSLSNTNAPMIAVPTQRATSEAEADYDFKHLAGVFRFVFNNPPADADKFTLTLGGKKINGTFTATIGNETTLVTGEAADGEKTTTLKFAVPEGAKSITLYVPVPTGEYKGITATMYAGEKVIGTWGKETANNTVVRRSVILMAPITFSTADGDIENNVNVATEKQLVEAVAKGGTITLTEDISLSEILVISKNTTLDGNGHKITSSAGRAINVSGADDVTIKNLTIVASGERAINVIQNTKKVTIDNVIATAANYTVNVASSAPGAEVYIDNSTLSGLCTVNVSSSSTAVTVKNSTINCNDNNTTVGEAYAAISLNKEAIGGKIISTNTVVNVTEGSDSYKGRNGAENGEVTINGSTEDVVVMVAAIIYPNSDYYHAFASLDGAIQFDKDNDGVVTLIRDITVDETITIAKDNTVVLDLNGKTISQRKAQSTGYSMISNKGKLTIKNGTLDYGDIAELTSDINYVSNTIWNADGAELTIEPGVTVVNNSNTAVATHGYPHAIDNYGTLTINGGTFTNNANYSSMRIWCTTDDDTKVTINNGNFNGSIDLHNVNNNANKGTLTINGGTFNADSYTNSAVRLLGFGVDVDEIKAYINGGTFNGLIKRNKYAGGEFNNEVFYINGGVFSDISALYYTTSTAKVTVMLSADVTLTEPLIVKGGTDITLDLNGKTVSQEKECTASYSMITNNGALRIMDSSNGLGKISFKDTGAGDPSFGWGSYTIRNNGGNLTIDNAKIEHLGKQDFATHMICAVYQYSGSTTINGGVISTPYYRSARLWKGDMTINGGTFDGQLWVQSVDDSAELTISGGEFMPNGGDGSSVFVENKDHHVDFNVTGGKFNTKIGCADPSKAGVKGKVKGGIFTDSAKTNTNVALIAEGYEFEQNADGTYTLTQKN